MGNPGVGRTSISRLFLFSSHPPCFVAGQRDFWKSSLSFSPGQREQPTEQGKSGDPTLRESEDATEALSPD